MCLPGSQDFFVPFGKEPLLRSFPRLRPAPKAPPPNPGPVDHPFLAHLYSTPYLNTAPRYNCLSALRALSRQFFSHSLLLRVRPTRYYWLRFQFSAVGGQGQPVEFLHVLKKLPASSPLCPCARARSIVVLDRPLASTPRRGFRNTCSPFFVLCYSAVAATVIMVTAATTAAVASEVLRFECVECSAKFKKMGKN